MKYAPILLVAAAAGLAALLPAQGTPVSLPQITFPQLTVNNFPVAGPQMRYQQWFAPSQFALIQGRATRLVGLDLVAGPGGQAGAQIDIEVTMANGPSGGPTQFMDSNYVNPFRQQGPQLPPVVVVPRSLRTLGPAVAGTFPLVLNFQNDFIWDGESGVVVDIKIFDNGKGNQSYNYDLEFTTRGFNVMWRLWGFSTDPRTVTTASTLQNGSGITMRFRYAEGLTLSYGTGCAGAGNVVPVASTTGGLPIPINAAWTHVVTQANSSKPAFLFLGNDNTMIGGAPLPLDLIQIGIVGGCKLWTNSVIALPATTVGGGAGAGMASINVPIPGVTLQGLSLYSQWMVVDDQAPNGWLSLSQAQWHIFG